MYYGVFHCFMGCHEWFKTWVCFMGCCIVSGGVVLFHGVLYCFMGCSTVSWGVVLFQGVLYYFMGCCIVSWGAMSGLRHGSVSWGVVFFHWVLRCFRALMFLANSFGGVVQDMELEEEDQQLLALVTRELQSYIDNLEHGR